MANPQKENGYTAIANELLEHLIMPGTNGSELKLILFVVRKTYGFSKKQDKISLSQFCKGLSAKRANICRTIKSLVAKRLLLKQDSLYKLNKNWEEWVVAKRLPSSQTDNRVVAKRLHTKETITKEIKRDGVLEENPLKAKDFLQHYFTEYKRLIGDNLPVHSERIILPRIEAQAELFGGYEKLKKLLKVYFDQDGKFYKENRWSLTCFLSEAVLNKLND